MGKGDWMTEDQITYLETINDAMVILLLDEYKKIMKSPHLKTLKARLKMQESVDNELLKNQPSIFSIKKDDASFDRWLSYAKSQPELSKGTEEIKKLLSEKEVKELENEMLNKSKEKNKMLSV